MQTSLNIVYIIFVGAGAIGGILTCIAAVGWVIQQLADYVHDHRLF